MKLAIIVVEFPSVTETFIARDVASFIERGHEVRLYHIAPFNKSAQVHAFAEPVVAVARGHAFLFSRPTLAALGRALFRQPRTLARMIREVGFECWREPMHLIKSLALMPKSLAISQEIVYWGADHVHAEFAGHPGTAAWIIGRMTGLPYSMSCRAHDIFVTQALLNTKVREAAFVRTISHYNIDFLCERLPDFSHENAFVIHSSVDTSQIRVPEVSEGLIFRVLYVGSLEVRKGVNVLLRALAEARGLGDWRCDVIGDGVERARLAALARQLGVAECVTFHGAQPFEFVSRAYAAADVVVAPSGYGPQGRTEGIPNVVIEALAHRRPVITTRISGIPELICDGKTGLLIEPNDVAGLVAAIESVREDPERARAMAEAGHAVVCEEFDLSRNVDAQIRLFEMFSGNRRSA